MPNITVIGNWTAVSGAGEFWDGPKCLAECNKYIAQATESILRHQNAAVVILCILVMIKVYSQLVLTLDTYEGFRRYIFIQKPEWWDRQVDERLNIALFIIAGYILISNYIV